MSKGLRMSGRFHPAKDALSLREGGFRRGDRNAESKVYGSSRLLVPQASWFVSRIYGTSVGSK